MSQYLIWMRKCSREKTGTDNFPLEALHLRAEYEWNRTDDGAENHSRQPTQDKTRYDLRVKQEKGNHPRPLQTRARDTATSHKENIGAR